MASFTGTTGNDVITGTDDADVIDVSQGGKDKVSAGGGDDLIVMGAAFGKGDRIDGGDGFDRLSLNGDYAGGVSMGLHGIEEVDLAAGHDYKIALKGVAKGQTITFDGHGLGSGDFMGIDLTQASSGDIVVLCGSGNDTITGASKGKGDLTVDGGAGNDKIYSQGTQLLVGASRVAHDISGGDGDDQLYVSPLDHVTGGDGHDLIDISYTAYSPYTLDVDGGAGDDEIGGFEVHFNVQTSVIEGGDGIDELSGGRLHFEGPGSFSASAHGFEIFSAEGFFGSDGDDTIDLGGLQSDANFGSLLRGGLGNDTIIDCEGDNAIEGDYSATDEGGGDDVLSGMGGDDFIDGGSGSDVMSGGIGNDNVTGDAGDDTITGDDGDDFLDGGADHDLITGGSGRDTIKGGDGADVFIYLSTADSAPGLAKRDVVTDFSHAGGDTVDLSAIDADTTQTGDQSFHLGGASFTHSAGELIQHIDRDGHTLLQGDVDGDGVADFAIQFSNAPVFVSGDLVL